jgi:phosphatidylserine decarboxylase
MGAVLALALGVAFAHKWQLGVLRGALAIVVLSVPVAVALAVAVGPFDPSAPVVVVAQCAATLTLAGAIVLQRFFRDPDRTPPDQPDAVVSPADGEVIYVRRSAQGELPVSTKNGRNYSVEDLVRTPLAAQEAVVVGISLSFLDVHVNRSPIAGEVIGAQRYPGLFGSLRRQEMAFENERATILIRGRDLQVAVVLIASRLVRQIVMFVRDGQRVAMAERVGVIRFGSQVDLVLPARPDLTITVRPGDRVTAGETVVAVTGSAKELGDAPAAEHIRLTKA